MSATIIESNVEYQPVLEEHVKISTPKKESIALYIIMFVHGISLLFSWTSLLFSYHYFTNRLKEWKNNTYVLDYLLLIFFFIRLVSLLFTPYFLKKLDHFALIKISQTGIFICFLVFGFVAMFGDSLPNGGFLAITIIIVFLSAIFSVISYQSGLSIVTQVPPKYTQALSAGQGSAIVVSSLMKLVSVLVTGGGGNTGNSSVVYFWMTSACSLIALLSFIPVKGIISKWNVDVENVNVIQNSENISIDSLDCNLTKKNHEYPTLDSQNTQTISLFQSYLSVYRKIPIDFWIMFIIAGQYIFILPAFVNPIRSTKFQEYNDANSLYSIQIFTIFLSLIMGFGDFIGRMILRWEKVHIQHRLLHPSLIAFRFILTPFILLSNLYFGNESSYPIPRIFANDIAISIILVFFGISGGFSLTHWLMFTPRKISDLQERKQASFIGVAFMTFGMLFGTLLALIYKILVLEWIPSAD